MKQSQNNDTVIMKEVSNYYLKQLQNNQDNEMSEEKKKNIENRILSKLKMGKKLTAGEMEYLRKYNTTLYYRALRIQKMAEAVKEQIKHAKSKEEVDRIVAQNMEGISDKDPDKECIVAAINEVANKFKQTDAYKRLPNTDEEAQKRKKSGAKAEIDFDNDDEDSKDLDFDVMNWTPLQEVIDSLPTLNINA